MSSHTPVPIVRFRSVLLLTVLCLLFMSAMFTVGITLLPEGFPFRFTEDARSGHIAAWRSASLVLAPVVYVWFCSGMTRGRTGRWAAMRHAFGLQLQAAVEAAFFAICVGVMAAAVDFVIEPGGDEASPLSVRSWFDPGRAALSLYALALALPAVSMIMAAWRLHAFAKLPNALVAAINGTLCSRDLVLRADAEDVRSELARHLQRLTSPDMPGLGRVIYGSHPKLTSRDVRDGTVHELVWWSCPMKLLVSCCMLAEGEQELQVRCVLRSGYYRMYLFPTPADSVAQMQYIETHLVQPLSAQIARAAAERQRDALRDQAVAAQLRILQAQIEPHFLFNTLANVRQLYRASVPAGEVMMDHLIAYLRCAIDDLRAEQSSVVKEMDVAMHFLSIMQIRMGDKLSYQFAIPESLLRHPFPPAMLISLIENAIKHGLRDCERGEITMSAARDGNTLRITVADNGAGFSSVGGTGVGLSNIRQRLEATYGSRAWLEVGAPSSGGFAATIVIPIEERNH